MKIVRRILSHGSTVPNRETSLPTNTLFNGTLCWATKQLSAFISTLAAVSMTTMLVTSQAYGDSLFATSGAGENPSTLFELDPTTGAIIRTIGPIGFTEVVSLDFHPITGVLFGISNASNALITIDTTTGAGTLVANLTGPMTGRKAPDVGFASDGTLYTWSEPSPDRLNAIDVTTGVSTEIGPNPLDTFQLGLDVDSTDTVYIKNGDGEIYTVDKTTGAATFVVDIDINDTNQFDNALAFDSIDNLFTIDRTGSGSDLYTIDLTSGATTLIGSTGIEFLAAIAFENQGKFTLIIKKAEVNHHRSNGMRDRVEFEGRVILGAESDGINLGVDDVVVRVGPSSITIPAGSFLSVRSHSEFEGTIDGAQVKMQLKEIRPGLFRYKIKAKGLDLAGISNPVNISLRMGNDFGTAEVKLEGELEFIDKKRHDGKKHHRKKEREEDD